MLVVKLLGYNNDRKKQWTEKKTMIPLHHVEENHFQCIWVYSIRIWQLEWNSEHHLQTVHTFFRQHHTYYDPIRLLVKNYCACIYSNSWFRLDSSDDVRSANTIQIGQYQIPMEPSCVYYGKHASLWSPIVSQRFVYSITINIECMQRLAY